MNGTRGFGHQKIVFFSDFRPPKKVVEPTDGGPHQQKNGAVFFIDLSGRLKNNGGKTPWNKTWCVYRFGNSEEYWAV